MLEFSYHNYSDADLVLMLRDSDETAFAELYKRYWEKLLYRATQRLSSSHDACEVVQDIFIGLWKKRERIALRHSFHTYISAVLKYEVIRKLAARKNIITISFSGETEHLKIADTATQSQLDFNDLQQRLESSVNKLPEKCRLVFRLSREQGMSEREISQTLHIAPKTVQGHLTRAIKILRSSLGGFFFLFF